MHTLNEWAIRWGVSPQALLELRQLSYSPAIAMPDEPESEDATKARVQITASEMGYALWRNNTGAMHTHDGRFVRFGLGNISERLIKKWKSPDLCGIGPNGRFIGVETKHPEWTEPRSDHDRAQSNCLSQINALGGIGIFCTHVDYFVERMRDAEKNKI